MTTGPKQQVGVATREHRGETPQQVIREGLDVRKVEAETGANDSLDREKVAIAMEEIGVAHREAEVQVEATIIEVMGEEVAERIDPIEPTISRPQIVSQRNRFPNPRWIAHPNQRPS